MMRSILTRGWYPALITVIAILGLIYADVIPYAATIPVLVVLLCIGLIVAVVSARNSKLELQALRLSQLATHFNRRFMGNSTLSIFAIIDGLFGMENTQVWEWARGCEMTRRIFESWTENFAARVESDMKNRRLLVFLNTHINEMWAINNHYYEFIEQFCEVAGRFEIPHESVEQYNKFTVEYNVFAENFRTAINDLKTVARTHLEAPSVKSAREL